MKLATALMLISVLSNSEAQPLPLEMQLPDWAIAKWERISKGSSLKLSGRLNPFLQRGDFDGDGKADLALFVESTKSGKYGITVLYAATARQACSLRASNSETVVTVLTGSTSGMSKRRDPCSPARTEDSIDWARIRCS